LHAQGDKTANNIDLSGYISTMPSIYWQKDTSMWQVLLHNRLNLEWNASDRFSASVQFRNQLIGGDFIAAQDHSNCFIKENYYLPLTYHHTFGDEYLLSLSVDRAWVQYTMNKLELKLGRQRINWGQTFVWNPNDIFNTYNFFDFDYPERPGTDAIRIQYYVNKTSSLDFAFKIDSAGKVTSAGLYRFNKLNYDFQFMTGNFKQLNQMVMMDTIPIIKEWEDNDLVIGLGFSGAVKSFSLRGELSYFYSLKANCDTTNQLLISLATDHTFSNEIYLLFEFFYADKTFIAARSNLLSLYSGTQNVKTQAYTHYNFFGQVSYPISPILSATLSGMCFFDWNILGFYTGPSMDVSLSDNMDISAYFQVFSFRMENDLTKKKEWLNANFAFLRWKLNF
jgi:hypothetical protein